MLPSQTQRGYSYNPHAEVGSSSSRHDYGFAPHTSPPQASVPQRPAYHQTQYNPPIAVSERVSTYPASTHTIPAPLHNYRHRNQPYQSNSSYEPYHGTFASQTSRYVGDYGPVSSQGTYEEVYETRYHEHRQAQNVPNHGESGSQAHHFRYQDVNQISAPQRPRYLADWSTGTVEVEWGEHDEYDENEENDEYDDYVEYEEDEKHGQYDEPDESDEYDDCEGCNECDEYGCHDEYDEYEDDEECDEYEDDGECDEYEEDEEDQDFEPDEDPPYSIRLIPGLVSEYGMDIYNELDPEARAVHCQNIESETLDLRRENSVLRSLCTANNISVSSDTFYSLARQNRPRHANGSSELYEEITRYERRVHNWYIRAELSKLEEENEELRQILDEECICVPFIFRKASHPLRQFAIRVQYGQLCTDQDLGTLDYC